MSRWGLAAVCAVLTSLPVLATEPRKGDFLQDYITCGLWMKRQATDAEMHASIGRWMVDALRKNSPSKLPHLADADLIDAVERHCAAQPGHSLSIATFLAGSRLPD